MNDLHLSKTNSRALNIYNARRRGMSLIQIARQYGVSFQYVYQLELRGRRIANDIENKNVAGELSERARNALVAWDCDPSPEAVIARFTRLTELKRVPALGTKSIGELQAWLVRHGKQPISE
jgi:hypothetical protein